MGTGADSNLPAVGDLAWGTPLNNEIIFDEAAITTLQTGLAGHIGNIPADPHGDRAYALNLIAPLTFGVNDGVTAILPHAAGGQPTGINPSGYVKLIDGVIPYSLLPGGAGLSNFVDVVKDYGAKGDGSTDDAAAINAALLYIAEAGGGVVFLPGGYNFAIAETLVIGANTWLMISPDAFITRIDVGAGPPTTMLANWTAGGVPATGNIMVTGGVWNFSNKTTSGQVFSFANCSSLTIQNTNVEARPDGASPVGKFFGCSFVLLDNIITTAGTPFNSRASCNAHVFEFRYLQSSNISGLASSAYVYNATTNPLRNSNVQVRNCPLNVATSSDATGPYCGWYSMCGNFASSEPNYSTTTVHIYFIIQNCSATCLTQCGISFYNCNFVTHKGCAYNYPPAPYFQGWNGTAPTVEVIVWDTEGNAPEKFFTPGVSYPADITTETIIIQHAIPASDWCQPLGGNSSTTVYAIEGIGHFTVPSNVSITFNLYIGTTGLISGGSHDTKCGTIGPITLSTCSMEPWHIRCGHIGIDGSGNWWPGEFALLCNSLSSSSAGISCGNTYCTPAPYKIVYITISFTFGTANTGNVCFPHSHVCRREHT